MPIEFLGIAALNDGGETHARSTASFDPGYTLRLAAAHEESGGDRILFAYHSDAPDPTVAATFVASRIENLQLLLAHRPNSSYPTVAAKAGAVAGARGNSRALVGTPETVAAALLDDVDLGVDIISARGYDSLDDALDFGHQVIPLVRAEVARRDTTARTSDVLA